MHEQALLRDLLRKVTEVADGRPVLRIHLWVGGLSHLTEVELREQWSLASAGSVAEGAALEVDVSDDLDDPRAQGVVLTRLDVGSGGSARTSRAGSESTPG